VLVFLGLLGVFSLLVWKLVWCANVRRGLLGQRDLIKAAFADIGHQTRESIKYAALMAKVLPPPPPPGVIVA